MVSNHGFAAAAAAFCLSLHLATTSALPQPPPQEPLGVHPPCEDDADFNPSTTITKTITWNLTVTSTVTLLDATEPVTQQHSTPSTTTTTTTTFSSSSSLSATNAGPVLCTLSPSPSFYSSSTPHDNLPADTITLTPAVLSSYALRLARQFCSSASHSPFTNIPLQSTFPLRFDNPPPSSPQPLNCDGTIPPPPPPPPFFTAGHVTFSYTPPPSSFPSSDIYALSDDDAGLGYYCKEEYALSCEEALEMIVRDCRFGEEPGFGAGSLDLGCGRWDVRLEEGEREREEGEGWREELR
ncbi:MAG: hypothetical protein Q9227_003051 [Pyrenula ochraceoflavens]